MDRFRYLKVGLAAILVFVGVKMTVVDLVKIPPALSLAVIAALLGAAIGASWWVTRREARAAARREAPAGRGAAWSQAAD